MKAKQQQNSAAALMQAEFPLHLLGRVCLTNVAQAGINETLRCVNYFADHYSYPCLMTSLELGSPRQTEQLPNLRRGSGIAGKQQERQRYDWPKG